MAEIWGQTPNYRLMPGGTDPDFDSPWPLLRGITASPLFPASIKFHAADRSSCIARSSLAYHPAWYPTIKVFGNDADRRSYIELLNESWRRFDCGFALTASWQARPFSCVLDDEHLWAAIRYVERNPVRAHMVERAEDYGWSSAAAHCGLREDSLLDSEWISANRIHNWSQWLAAGNPSKVDRRLRDRTFTAAPVETKPLLRKQNDCSAAPWQLKNRVQNLNRSPITRGRRFGQATTSSLDLLNSVSVPRSKNVMGDNWRA